MLPVVASFLKSHNVLLALHVFYMSHHQRRAYVLNQSYSRYRASRFYQWKGIRSATELFFKNASLKIHLQRHRDAQLCFYLMLGLNDYSSKNELYSLQNQFLLFMKSTSKTKSYQAWNIWPQPLPIHVPMIFSLTCMRVERFLLNPTLAEVQTSLGWFGLKSPNLIPFTRKRSLLKKFFW